MGLLDSNIFKQATKSINITGPATTSNSYLNGGHGIIDVSKYSTLCFQVKTITSGVKLRCYGGVTSNLNTLEAHNTYSKELCFEIDKIGTYWCNVSTVKSFGFYIKNGVENGQLDIDICLKTVPAKEDLKPIQLVASKDVTLTVNSTDVSVDFSNQSLFFTGYKFVIAYICFKNATNASVIKSHIALRTTFIFADGRGTYGKDVCENENTARLYSEWIPLNSMRIALRIIFEDAAAEGDAVHVELWGVR